MGCINSHADAAARPNLFQRNLCLHHKVPVRDVYIILSELGKGAFGVVEKVEHRKTKKQYAMKTVTFAKGSERSEFEKEIDILRGLHHPHIVRMVETYEDDHHFYIIMEMCTDGTLLHKVKERGSEFPEEYVKDAIAKLASVVQYLHSRFICHRDLKLENILLESQELGGDMKLCDFGASTLFRMGVPMRKVLGSVVYMAPEVLEGNYTQTCDLWSLGVIMYMLLSNKAPFHGATEDELIEKIFDAKVVFDNPVWNNVSPEAKALIKKMLNPDPATRYTAAQVLAHPWISSLCQGVPESVYTEFAPRLVAFCNYSAFQRAALVALAFCTPSTMIRQHSDLYNELNVAHNGLLTLAELQQAPGLKRFNLDLTKIYQAMNQQQESGVNLLEFVAATLDPAELTAKPLLRAAFRIFDRKDQGYITTEDLLELLGQHFDRAACQEMIKRSDSDRDGKIGFDDFSNMVKLTTQHIRLTRRRLSNTRRGDTTPTKSEPGSSPFRRNSASLRAGSSIDLGTAAKEYRRTHPRRHSSVTHNLTAEALDLPTSSTDTRDVDPVVEEIAHCASKAEAVKRIQSISLDLSKVATPMVKDEGVNPAEEHSEGKTEPHALEEVQVQVQ
ncbi:hypothetical protein Poli38472_005175 [Pythium oligandrum]|uniref:non-specific serine/threonine protein kinase n=1 Tax=Pythium oligandrum TaxID=41045 RepID=A0A8K1CFV2_PYTOL|nr:hypothetical protein Poli38472_005175 [Pythium oligandrum]|eukprot:TMW62557.1 hypothetical protein Poli38472_005175 [Pythium oligandrum]